MITKISNSPSLPSYSAATSSSKLANIQNKNKYSGDDFIIINEKVNLTKQQHEVLKTICDTYQMSFSEYMQQALIEAMMFDIEEGNFSDALLEKIASKIVNRTILLLRLLLLLLLTSRTVISICLRSCMHRFSYIRFGAIFTKILCNWICIQSHSSRFCRFLTKLYSVFYLYLLL